MAAGSWGGFFSASGSSWSDSAGGELVGQGVGKQHRRKMWLWRRFVIQGLSGFILAWENPEGCLCEENKEGEH